MPDTKISALAAVVTPAATDEFGVNQGAVSKKMTLAQIAAYLVARISGASGAAGEYKTLQKLSANAAANATITLATVMTTTAVGVGTWQFTYHIIYQAAATTTGVNFAVGHSGTTGAFVASSRFATSGGSAANALADQTASDAATLLEGKAARAKATKLGATLGVDTINADMHYVIEGQIVVTATGSLTLDHASEVAASSQVMANTALELTKIG